MDLDYLPLVPPSPPANALLPSPIFNPLLHFTWNPDNSNTTPVSIDFSSAESVLGELEDVHMEDAESSTYPQSHAPPIAGSNPGLLFNVHPLHPSRVFHPPSTGRAIRRTEASVTASATTQTFLSTSVSAPVAHTNASSVGYRSEAMTHYADLSPKEKPRIKHEETTVDDDLLALSEPPPGSLNVAAGARARSFPRTSNRSHTFRPQERFRHSAKGRSRFPRSGPITPVIASQGPTHNLHGLGSAFGGHSVHVASSICASGVVHDRRGEIASEIQPPTIVPSSQPTPLITKAPPSSPAAGKSGLFHTLPVPSHSLRTTTLSPSSSSAATAQKPNTKRGETRNVRRKTALHESFGYPQQVDAALPLGPSSNAIAQFPHSQGTPHTTSNVESSSVLAPSVIARSPVAQQLPVAPPSTPVPSSSSTASAILHPRLPNPPAGRPSNHQQQGPGPVAQSVGITVPIGQRPRPDWILEAEKQEEKEKEEEEKWNKTHFPWTQ